MPLQAQFEPLERSLILFTEGYSVLFQSLIVFVLSFLFLGGKTWTFSMIAVKVKSACPNILLSVCSGGRAECRESLSGPAAVFVRAAESGEDEPTGGLCRLFTEGQTDTTEPAGMFPPCHLFLFCLINQCLICTCRPQTEHGCFSYGISKRGINQ